LKTIIASRSLILASESINQGYSLLQICRRCHTDPEFVISIVGQDIMKPIGNRPIHWRFNRSQLELIQSILMLKHRYEMNLHGIKYVLNLLETNKALRNKLL
jgi:chaperone modulatory protein CbpM